MAKTIKMPFRGLTLVSPGNHVLGRGNWLSGPIKALSIPAVVYVAKQSIVNNGMQ